MALENAVIVSADVESVGIPAAVAFGTPDTPQEPTTPATPERDEHGRFVAVEPPVAAEPETPPAEPETAAGTEPEPVEPVAKKGSPQQRINQAIARQREAERLLDTERQANARYVAELAALRPATPPADPPAPAPSSPVVGEPTEDQYADFNDYVKALAVFHAKATYQQALADQRATAERDTAEARQKVVLTEHQTRVALGKTLHADYDEVVFREDVNVSAAMHDAIVHSPLGHELMYYLGKNTEDSDRIAHLPPGPALIEMGKLEARIEGATLKPVAAVPMSRTPPPITPVRGGTHTPRSDGRDLSLKDYIARRNAEEMARA
jgi:hypothetical protein